VVEEFRQGRPVFVKHDVQMHHGQSRGKQKTKKNQNRGIYKVCLNRRELCIMHQWLRGWTPLSSEFIVNENTDDSG